MTLAAEPIALLDSGDEPATRPIEPSLTNLRAGIELFLFVSLSFLGMPIQGLFVALKMRRARAAFPVLYHRILTRFILGMKIHQVGTPATGGPVLLVANHNSWLDIPVLGATGPLSFIAKSEVAAWPLFGWLAKLQRTVFVERNAKTKAAAQAAELLGRLKDGDRLVLFAEGTSSDGNRVLPFNSSLFGVAQLAEMDNELPPLIVQPVTVSYTRVHGVPMGRYYRPFFAWYGDMEMAPHLWAAFGLGPIDVVVTYHEPLTLKEAGNRKKLALQAEERTRAGMVNALHRAA